MDVHFIQIDAILNCGGHVCGKLRSPETIHNMLSKIPDL